MRRLILYRGIEATLDDFTEQICHAAADMRIPYLLLDVHEKGEVQLQKLNAFVKDGDCAAVLFNNIGLNLTVGGVNFWEAHHIPVCDILMDHPRNYDAVLKTPLRDLHFFEVDQNHIPFCETFFPEAQVHFLPHGGNIAFDAEQEIPWEERPIDVLLVSSCQKPLSYPAISFFADGGKRFYESVIGMLLREPALTTEEATERFLAAQGISLHAEDRYTLMMEYVIYAEYTVRRIFKLQIMEQLAQSGIRTEVYGANWNEPGYGTHGGMRYHEPVTPAVCNALAGKTKIALNIMPWFKQGAHDRIFTAMLQGAVSVTDESAYLTGRFTDGEDIVFYSLRDLRELPGKIRALLDDPERGRRIAEAGRKRALAEDTWASRLRAMMEMTGQQTTAE